MVITLSDKHSGPPTLATRLRVQWCGSYGQPCAIMNLSETPCVMRISRLAVSNGSNPEKGSATATAMIVFDGNTLVDGAANFPFPAPFIRVVTEK